MVNETSTRTKVLRPTKSLHRSKSHVYGLQHPKEDLPYPSHPANSRVKIISAHQYYELQAQELAQETPENVLFPWLHGADQRGTQQAYYFGYGSGGLKTPRCVFPKKSSKTGLLKI